MPPLLANHLPTILLFGGKMEVDAKKVISATNITVVFMSLFHDIVMGV